MPTFAVGGLVPSKEMLSRAGINVSGNGVDRMETLVQLMTQMAADIKTLKTRLAGPTLWSKQQFSALTPGTTGQFPATAGQTGNGILVTIETGILDIWFNGGGTGIPDLQFPYPGQQFIPFPPTQFANGNVVFGNDANATQNLTGIAVIMAY